MRKSRQNPSIDWVENKHQYLLKRLPLLTLEESRKYLEPPYYWKIDWYHPQYLWPNSKAMSIQDDVTQKFYLIVDEHPVELIWDFSNWAFKSKPFEYFQIEIKLSNSLILLICNHLPRIFFNLFDFLTDFINYGLDLK